MDSVVKPGGLDLASGVVVLQEDDRLLGLGQ